MPIRSKDHRLYDHYTPGTHSICAGSKAYVQMSFVDIRPKPHDVEPFTKETSLAYNQLQQPKLKPHERFCPYCGGKNPQPREG